MRPYETEEDLWEALHEGEITSEEFENLREVFRTGADSLFLPVSDWEELPGSGAGYLSPFDTTVGLTSIAPAKAVATDQPRMKWRSGLDGRLSAPAGQDGYVTGRVEGAGWRGLLNFRQDDRGAHWQRRVLDFEFRSIRLQAGNIEPRWGRGLVVGRRSRLIGSKETTRTSGDFWQPSLSRFNGILIGIDAAKPVSAAMLLSDIRSTSLRERVAGLQVTAETGRVQIGFSGLTGTIRRTDTSGSFAQRVAGGHVRIGEKKHALLAEIAVTERGASAKAAEIVWQFERGGFLGKAWSYSPEFLNPWGGGPAHGDGSTVELEEIGESYSSRTTGESGFSMRTQVDRPGTVFGGRLTAHWEWMTHRESPGDPLLHSWVVQLRWRNGGFVVRPFVRGTQDEEAADRHAAGLFANYGPAERRFSARFEAGRHHVDGDRYVRTGAGVKWQLNEIVRLEPRFRWVDPDLDQAGDGYWYFYFTEVILPSGAWRFEAALVWQRYERRDREDVAELRLRAVSGWL